MLAASVFVYVAQNAQNKFGSLAPFQKAKNLLK